MLASPFQWPTKLFKPWKTVCGSIHVILRDWPSVDCKEAWSAMGNDIGAGLKGRSLQLHPRPPSRLPSNTWTSDAQRPVAQYLKNKHEGKGEYLPAHVPRVCTRIALFDQCSKRPPTKVEAREEMLCHFVNTHQTMFFKVDGKGVYALRKNMQKSLPTGGLIGRSRRALARSMRSIRRFFFSKTSAALVLGASVGALCVASGLAGVVGGSLCAIGALGSVGLFGTLYAVSPFGAKPSIPVTLGAFLSTDFERNLQLTIKMLGQPAPQPSQALVTGAEEETML